MNLLFDINHPAHVHFFRHAIGELAERGCGITITARKKDVTVSLLRDYGLSCVVLSHAGRGVFGLAREYMQRQGQLARLLRQQHVQRVCSVGGTFCVHTARRLGIPTLVFYDSEAAALQNRLTFPFATKVATPSCYRDDLGRRHVRYDGYQELAYLHPNRFTPDRNIRRDLDIGPRERLFVLRFVAWQANHDWGKHGLLFEHKQRLVSLLCRYGRVVITSEKPLEPALEPYRLPVPAVKMLDVLATAEMLVTDSQTMTTEAALLGTPAVRVNAFAGPQDMGNFQELEQRYDLISSFREFAPALDRVKALLSVPDLKKNWQAKRERLLREKIDVTGWLVRFILDPETAIGAGKAGPAA